MTQANPIQLRGHCQCCGNDQAVVRGHMSKHGYTIKHGWFTGICSGERFAPIEQSREHADAVVDAVRKECDRMVERVEALRTGKAHPAEVSTGRSVRNPDTHKFQTVMIAWADASEYQRERAVEQTIRDIEFRIGEGRRFALYLEEQANTYHGKALMQVARTDGPAPVVAGERRVSSHNAAIILRVNYVERGRVYWIREGSTLRGSTGLAAWRKLAVAS